MAKTKLLFTACLIVLTGFNLAAQTKISGVIKDTKGEILIGANIYLEGTYDGTSSLADGTFSFETSETGKQNLRIDFIGFISFTQEILLSGKPVQVEIKMAEAFNELNAVTISAGTFEAGDKKKAVAVSSLDMVTTAGSSGDVYGALRSLPGTTTVGESGKLFVKGGDSRESKTFIDGTLVYVPYSSSAPNTQVRGRFNPFMFSGNTFSTGGYSAEYGQALSSVLALQTNEMPVEDQLNIGLLSVGGDLGLTKTWDQASVSASIGYNNLKPYMQLVPQNFDWNEEPSSLGGSVSARVKTAKSGLLKFYTNYSQSHINLNQQNLNNPGTTQAYDLCNHNLFVNTSWKGEIAKNWILSTGFSYTDNSDKVQMDSTKYTEFLSGSHAKVVLSHKVNDKIKVRAGTELYSKSFDISLISNLDSNFGYRNNTLSGFIESEIYTNSNFVTRLGGRLEYSDYLKKSSFAPRISSAYKLNKTSQVSISYGWFFQNPEDEFLLYTHQLNYERADHYTFNYVINAKGRTLRSELYYKDYKNLTKFTDDEFYTPEYYTNNGDGYAYGLDLFWRDNKSIKRGEYWISYSYIDAKRNYADYPVEAVPNFSSKHNLTLVYKHWVGSIRSLLGATYRISSPRFYDDPNTPEFNDQQTLAYQSLDVNCSFLYRQNVIFYASVSNVLGFKQEFGREYATVPNANGEYASSAIKPGAKRFFVLGCFITLSRKGDLNQLDKIN